jgi:DNA-binding NarL/FixJ family response regulator
MKTALSLKNEPRIDEASVDQLTGRQYQILKLVSIGHSNREIADILHISVRTVEVHRFLLMRKLNVRNVAQLLRRALQLGLLSPSLMRSQAGEPGIGKVERGVGYSRRLVKRK